ncbi:MAG: MFS transporter [Alkalispirochaeta sp.]
MTPDGSPSVVFRHLLAPAYLPVLFLSFSWSALTPAFPQYLTGLGAGLSTVGVIVAMKGFGQMASDLPGGFFLAFWGLRRATIASYAVAILSNAILFFSRSVPVITVLTFLSGFSTSILLTTVMTTVRRSVPPELRGRALSGVGGSVRFGGLLGPIAGGFVADTIGVPPIFIMRVAALSAGMVAFMIGMPKDEAPVDAPEQYSGSEGTVTASQPIGAFSTSAIRDLFRELSGRWRAIGTVGFAILILSALRSSREIVLPLWGAAEGFSPGTIGVAMSIGAVFDLLLFAPAGYISDRWGRRVSASLCLGVFSAGLFALVGARSFPLFILAASLIGFGNGFGAGIAMTTGADLAPDRSVAQFLGLWRLYGDLGHAIGPAAIGALSGVLAIAPAVMITGGVGVLGALVMLFLAPETRDL